MTTALEPRPRRRRRSHACCAAPGSTSPSATVVTFAEALAAVGVASRSGVYWAGRATLVRRTEDVPLYDRAFGAFWLGRRDRRARPRARGRAHHLAARRRGGLAGSDEQDGRGRRRANVSPCASAPHEVLRHKDFAAYTRRRARRGAPADGRPPPRRRAAARRGATGRSRRAGAAPTCAAPCAHALRAGGEPVRRASLEPASVRGGSCCCATSAGRWSRTPARCCASCTPRSSVARRSRRSPSALA